MLKYQIVIYRNLFKPIVLNYSRSPWILWMQVGGETCPKRNTFSRLLLNIFSSIYSVTQKESSVFLGNNPGSQVCCKTHKSMFLTKVEESEGEHAGTPITYDLCKQINNQPNTTFLNFSEFIRNYMKFIMNHLLFVKVFWKLQCYVIDEWVKSLLYNVVKEILFTWGSLEVWHQNIKLILIIKANFSFSFCQSCQRKRNTEKIFSSPCLVFCNFASVFLSSTLIPMQTLTCTFYWLKKPKLVFF